MAYGIIFTIETSYSEERYFLEVDEREFSTLQIHDCLAKMGFCDAYEITGIEDVSTEYMEERKELLAKCESYGEKLQDVYIPFKYCTNETLKDAIEWASEKL